MTNILSVFRDNASESLPSQPDSRELVYVGGADPVANATISSNIEKIKEIVSSRDLKLFYLPDFLDESVAVNRYPYYFPDAEGVSLTDVCLDDVYHKMWKVFLPETQKFPKNCAFFHIADDDTLHGLIIGTKDIKWIESDLQKLCDEIRKNNSSWNSDGSQFGLVYNNYPKEEFADREFDTEVYTLSSEIRERIAALRVHGVSEMVIQSLFQKEQKLSRLVVTDDYRIILPDYNDMEVPLEPLPKAVYFLYLKHPEGLMFKELPGFRDEFMDIYRRLTNRSNEAVASKSVERVLDPTNNSINEKCSRIREAFISRFDDELAKKYYITHYYELKKRIRLDRDMVDFGPLK